MVEFTLPWPPSLNRYYRVVGEKVLISQEGREYRTLVCKTPLPKAPTGRLSVTLLIYPPDARRRDIDNLTKCLLDALTHAGVYEDDSLIDELRIIRKDIVKPGSVGVSIAAL